MLVKISRYTLVVITIIVSSFFLSSLYWKAFDTKRVKPYISYSSVNHKFMMRSFKDGKLKMYDQDGKTYSKKEYESALPVTNIRQLMASNIMPDTINGIEVDYHSIHIQNFYKRFRAKGFNKPQISLHPLLESQSGRVKLEMPSDYFRINERIEFLDASSNRVNKSKSNLFNKALTKEGFSFPAKEISGIPTTRKSCDEGYFITDNNYKLFHLKMIKGKPFVKNIAVPNGVKIENIVCADLKNKEFLAYLFTDKSELYLIKNGNYKLIHFPLDGYDKNEHTMRVMGNIFYRLVTIESKNFVKVYVYNRDYQLLDSYGLGWKAKHETTVGKIANQLFPFQIKLKKSTSSYIDFYTNGYKVSSLNILLVILLIIMIKRRKQKFKNNIIDLIVVMTTGIFGFIAILTFKNSDK